MIRSEDRKETLKKSRVRGGIIGHHARVYGGIALGCVLCKSSYSYYHICVITLEGIYATILILYDEMN